MRILTSFRQRQSVEEAEGKARALLPAGVDLERFAGDAGYRQVRTVGGVGAGILMMCRPRVFFSRWMVFCGRVVVVLIAWCGPAMFL